MELERDTNYIVSGLERSGTSMLMQILYSGGIPTDFDQNSRPPDESNPKGYYELEGGKIINKLMEGSFSLEKYKGRFIKITAYGLKFLPPGKYKIIYSERNIEEILDSMEKMAKSQDEDREETKQAFLKLNKMIKKLIQERDDTQVLLVNYNEVLKEPKTNIQKICKFLNISEENTINMLYAVDKNLYRQRRK